MSSLIVLSNFHLVHPPLMLMVGTETVTENHGLIDERQIRPFPAPTFRRKTKPGLRNKSSVAIRQTALDIENRW